MKPVRYVILDPTGNLTALVTRWDVADEKEITARLMRESEQVAYLDPPSLPGALARVRLMGGEFCGNAAMAAAGWLVRDWLAEGREMTVPIEVSGAEGMVFCRIRGQEDGFTGTVEMPRVLGIRPVRVGDVSLYEVRMSGITHLIREARAPMEKAAAESLLTAYAEASEAEAAGLMDLETESGFMRPLVWVRGSGTLVWETACGSGTAAAGALAAWRKGGGTAVTDVRQPGGTLRAEAEAENGAVTAVRITGRVRMGAERTVSGADGNTQKEPEGKNIDL